MNGGVSEYLISWNIFLSKTLNIVFQILRDFVCKQGEQIHRGAFSCDTRHRNFVTHFYFALVTDPDGWCVRIVFERTEEWQITGRSRVLHVHTKVRSVDNHIPQSMQIKHSCKVILYTFFLNPLCRLVF